ncbi:hypothetical protein [Neobacillus drentensis]|uniref:hypothetical protein n=1 Tax=Neobacillus drentensis TaxID=220684 RepID=UPI000826A140|nr:hypothetical protein [Neobacillus drentensis]
MYEKKEALLQRYYQLTSKLVNEMTENGVGIIQAALNERQACILEINQMDQGAGQILLNSAIEKQLLRIHPLEAELKRMLERVQQKVLANLHALKKEKTIKQYGESTYGSSGLFYDKRK